VAGEAKRVERPPRHAAAASDGRRTQADADAATKERVRGELRSVNPATLEPVGAVPLTPPEQVDELVREAAAVQTVWAGSSFAERRKVLTAVLRFVSEHADDIAATITAETGKPLTESFTSELVPAADNVRWAAANVEAVLSPERLRMPQPHLQHKRAYLVYEPVGVIGVISPWNFPFSIPFGQVAFAVAAGNAVVLKPSELTPLTGQWVQRAFAGAGAPAGLVLVAHGDGETVGDALARSDGLGRLVFTGSTEVGRQVAVLSAERLRPVTLELGGKDPMLVFEDADLDRAVAGAVWGSFLNCGQVCTSVERLYVAEDVYDDVVTRVAEGARKLRLGRGEDEATDVGPLISDHQRAKVEDLVSDAVEHGADAVTGARRPDLPWPGWFYEPTVLTGVKGKARIVDEEIFGPVVTVAPFSSEDEAVALANASRYGLGASVWTRDEERAERIAARLEAGMVWTNDIAYSFGTGQATWGGVKQSGYGRSHSKHGLYECSRVKLTDLDTGRVAVPWWYPYGPQLADGFRGVLGVLYGVGGGPRLRAAWRHRRGLLQLLRRYLRR
jgi:acyl-CoA reductase-like NAD-dependent aldehyde dehydrogenase